MHFLEKTKFLTKGRQKNNAYICFSSIWRIVLVILMHVAEKWSLTENPEKFRKFVKLKMTTLNSRWNSCFLLFNIIFWTTHEIRAISEIQHANFMKKCCFVISLRNYVRLFVCLHRYLRNRSNFDMEDFYGKKFRQIEKIYDFFPQFFCLRLYGDKTPFQSIGMIKYFSSLAEIDHFWHFK